MSRFETTRWSLVLQARDAVPQARAALEVLCSIYRPPVLAYVRARGHAPDAAEDLAQAFFASFLEHAWHANADPARGRFRAYLLTALKRHLADHTAAAHALKRGGNLKFESLDEDAASMAASEDLPDRAFERAWAMTVLRTAVARLQAEAESAGKHEWFVVLREFVVERPEEADYARAAEILGLRRNTLAVAVHRLRHRLRELVEEELAQTTHTESDFVEETRELRAALGAAIS